MSTRLRKSTSPYVVADLFNRGRLELPEGRYEWKSMSIYDGRVDLGATTPPAYDKIVGCGKLRTASFPYNALDEVQFAYVMPSDYVPGTRVYTFLDWAPSDICSGRTVPNPGDSRRGDVIWMMQTAFYSPATSGTVGNFIASSPTKNANSSAHWYKRVSVAAKTQGRALRMFFDETFSTDSFCMGVRCRVARATNKKEDTLYNDGLLLAVGVRYQADTLGGATRTSKY